MTLRLMVLNGPNLNLLGGREPHIYGSTTLAAIGGAARNWPTLLVTLQFEQSNHEVLPGGFDAVGTAADAIIINPAGYSFTSVAIFDALKTFRGPSLKCTSRTSTPATNYIATPYCPAAKAVICGLGPYGYIVAIQAAAQILGALRDKLPRALCEGPH